MATGFDSMGPRIDVSHSQEADAYLDDAPAPNPYQTPRSRGGGGGLGAMLVAVIGLAVALLSGGVGIWALMAIPERVPGPPPSADVVPGGAAERVAKLEKDVSQLMLRLVTLEKELAAVAGKAGSITKLVEINAKVAALQTRIEAMGGGKIHVPASTDEEAAPAPRAAAKAPAPAPAPRPEVRPEARPEARHEARPEARPEVSPAVKAVAKAHAGAEPEPAGAKKAKQVYTVRKGDTLFSVAMRYKVSTEDIMRWNNMQQGDMLKTDQQLVIYK
jgi:LysM repeat protein